MPQIHPDNEIWYTTADGEALGVFEKANNFGDDIALVSNKDDGDHIVARFSGRVTRIDASALDCCGAIREIALPGSVAAVGDYAFMCCAGLRRVVLPEGIQSIGYRAFCGCSVLADINLPDSINAIGGFAFKGCGSLEAVCIPKSLQYVEAGTFQWCSKLSRISIPKSVESIGDSAFYGCEGIRTAEYEGTAADWCSVLLASHYSSPMNGAETVIFAGEPVGRVLEIPDTAAFIRNYSFCGFRHIEGVSIPDTVTSIASCAFYGCSSLKSICVPDSVAVIGSDAFCNCRTLESVTLPKGLAYIDEYTFSYCMSLRRIVIPDTVSHIGRYAFLMCNALIDRLAASGRFYKGFGPGMTGLRTQFAEGEESVIDTDGIALEPGEYGFHFCDNPLSVFNHYYGAEDDDVVVYEVAAAGSIVIGTWHVGVCERLTPVRRVPFKEIFKMMA